MKNLKRGLKRKRSGVFSPTTKLKEKSLLDCALSVSDVEQGTSWLITATVIRVDTVDTQGISEFSKPNNSLVKRFL